MSRIVINIAQKIKQLNLSELYAYRDLFLILTYRDIKIKYAQTFLGLFWALFQPLAQLTILTFVFGKVIVINTGSIPHPLFTLSGMCSWVYFSLVLQQSGNSLIGAQDMVKKIYFPRLIIPLSKAILGFIDFGITLIFLVCLLFYYGFIPSINIIFLPIFILLTVTIALGAGIWTSALSIRYRDFQYIIPFLLQFGLYATPIAYPVSMVPDKFQWIFHLNPMTGIVEGFRWCILGERPPSELAYLSYFITFLIFISSLFYFKKAESTIADII